jgi:hypothetical protein
MTDTRDCSCADLQRSRTVCKHIRAVRFWMVAYQTAAVAPKPRHETSAEDDRIALTPDGAAYLASLDADTAPADEILVEEAFAGVSADHGAQKSARRRMSYAEMMDNHLVLAQLSTAGTEAQACQTAGRHFPMSETLLAQSSSIMRTSHPQDRLYLLSTYRLALRGHQFSPRPRRCSRPRANSCQHSVITAPLSC